MAKNGSVDKKGDFGLPVQPNLDFDPKNRTMQAPQAPSDRHFIANDLNSNIGKSPRYDNDVDINSWLRGGGKGQATDKPGFCKPGMRR
jgi:hypothetical protein